MFQFLKRLCGARPNPRLAVQAEEVNKASLRGMLHDPRFTWRSIGALASGINATAGETRQLLAAIGARKSRKEKEVYTLDGMESSDAVRTRG